MIAGIVGTQVRSLLGSLVGVGLVATLLFRSIRRGIACTLPALCAVAAVLGAMGWLSIPLGVATSMFTATVVGIGVDYAIHWLHRAEESSPAEASRITAPVLMLDAVAIAAAFGLLAASRVPSNARLGVLTALSLIACVVVTLAVIPSWSFPAQRASAKNDFD